MPLDPGLFAAFLVAAWVLILTPGPDTLFVLGQTLAGGRAHGWAAVGGIVTGAMVHISAAAGGIAALLATHPALFGAVQIAGAAYLAWLGLGALRGALQGGADSGLAARMPGQDRGRRNAFLQGLLTNLLNPKVALFFLAFLPQFVDPERAPAWLQMALLGPLVPLMALPFFALVIAGTDRAAARLVHAGGGRGARWLQGTASVLFLGLGLRLALQAARA